MKVILWNLTGKFPKEYVKEYDTFLTFSQAQQVFYLIWKLDAEVKNGGFNQYYFNTRGKYAHMAPKAFRLLGANQFADLVDKANLIYESENEKITKHQDGTVEGFSKSYKDNPLNSLDTEYYMLDKNEELEQLQIEYIRKNKIDFVDK